MLAPPHTGGNYLLREMVYVVGRSHARKLRLVGIALAVLLPLVLVTATPFAPMPMALALAAISHVAGALVLRWLFFAEAEHVVGLYYGKR